MNDKAEDTDRTKNSEKPKRKRGGIVVIVMIFVALVFFSRQQAVTTIDCNADIIASKPDVIMLGAWWCSYCYQAKKYFQKKNIHYCEYDMENTFEGRRLYEQHGGGSVPIMLIGDHQLRGFNEKQIEAAIAAIKK